MKKNRNTSSGFSLIEVIFSLLLMSLSGLALLILLNQNLKIHQRTQNFDVLQQSAKSLMDQILAEKLILCTESAPLIQCETALQLSDDLTRDGYVARVIAKKESIQPSQQFNIPALPTLLKVIVIVASPQGESYQLIAFKEAT